MNSETLTNAFNNYVINYRLESLEQIGYSQEQLIEIITKNVHERNWNIERIILFLTNYIGGRR